MTTLNSQSHQLPKGIIHNFTSEQIVKRMYVEHPYSFIKIFIFQFFYCHLENKNQLLEPKINLLIDFIQSHEHLLHKKNKRNTQNSNPTQDLINFIQILLQTESTKLDLFLLKNTKIWQLLSYFLFNLLISKYNLKQKQINSILSIHKLCQIFDQIFIQNQHYLHFINSKVFQYSHQNHNYIVYSSKQPYKPINQHQMIHLISSQNSIQHNFLSNFQNSEINIDFDNITANALPKDNNFHIKTPTYQKRISNFNINEQLPNEFILDNLVTQPYRTKINNIKAQANQMYLKT